MAEITSALVKELRERTGAGMMDCKRALAEVEGDLEAASDWLRKKGLAAAAKKVEPGHQRGPDRHDPDRHAPAPWSRSTPRPISSPATRTSRSWCAGSRRWRRPPRAISRRSKAARIEATGRTVADEITQAIAVIGENINLRRTAYLEVPAGRGRRLPAQPAGAGSGQARRARGAGGRTAEPARLAELGKQLAMHVAATNPQAVTADLVDPSVVARERAIFADQARASGKPENIIEKMVEGRMRKFYEESVLLEQVFVVDPDKRVKEAVQAVAKETGAPIEIAGFVRLALGEGVEKGPDDFAAEVAQLAGV